MNQARGIVRGNVSKLIAASAHVAPISSRSAVHGKTTGPGGPQDCKIVEVTDLAEAIPGDAGSEAWINKAKIALKQLFARFGAVLDVKIPTAVAKVRFASSKAGEDVMRAAPRGFLELGDHAVRLRLPGAAETVWQRFPPTKRPVMSEDEKKAATKPACNSQKKKLRPNERFATRLPSKAPDEELDESERFWEEQRRKREGGTVPDTAAPPVVEPPAPSVTEGTSTNESQSLPVVAEEPERPVPVPLPENPGEEDVVVRQGEEEIAAAMATLLEQPFSHQRKALKALRRQWHPDKRPDDQGVATRVFQFIQAHDAWLRHHGLL